MSVPRILQYPGSKWSMYDWINGHMPSTHAFPTYVDLFFGSGGEFFNKPRHPLETINDLDGNVVNLFKVIRDDPEKLAHVMEWTPYSREEYYRSYDDADTDIEKARRFLVRTWQAIGAKTSDRTGWKSVIQFDKAPNKTFAKAWMEVPDKIMAVTERLKGVQIEQQPAVQILERYKHEDVLIYADPPYLLSTRSKRLYKHEMKDSDHIELLEALKEHPGPVLLSGYDHPLYNDMLHNWRREELSAYADSKRPRTEVLWLNQVAAEHSVQITLF